MKYVVILGLLAACTDVDPDSADTPIPAQTLCGHATPTIAEQDLWLHGRVVTVTDGANVPTGVADIAVERLPNWDSVAHTQAFSDHNFDTVVKTEGLPLAAMVIARMDQFATTYYVATVPWTSELTLPSLWMMDGNAYARRAEATSVDNGLLVVAMRDCSGLPLSGTSISVSPAATIWYYGSDGKVKPTADATTFAAMVTNVPTGTVTITTPHATQPLRTAHAAVFGNSVTMVDLYPQ